MHSWQHCLSLRRGVMSQKTTPLNSSILRILFFGSKVLSVLFILFLLLNECSFQRLTTCATAFSGHFGDGLGDYLLNVLNVFLHCSQNVVNTYHMIFPDIVVSYRGY